MTATSLKPASLPALACQPLRPSGKEARPKVKTNVSGPSGGGTVLQILGK